MGFGHKRNVCNLEKKPARRVAWEQQERERLQKEVAAAALKATEQDAKVAALEAKVAEMQVLAALCGSAPVPGPPRPSAPIAPPHIPAPSAFAHLMHPPHVDNNRTTMCLHHLSLLRRSKLRPGLQHWGAGALNSSEPSPRSLQQAACS